MDENLKALLEKWKEENGDREVLVVVVPQSKDIADRLRTEVEFLCADYIDTTVGKLLDKYGPSSFAGLPVVGCAHCDGGHRCPIHNT